MKLFMPPLINNKEIIEQRERDKGFRIFRKTEKKEWNNRVRECDFDSRYLDESTNVSIPQICCSCTAYRTNHETLKKSPVERNNRKSWPGERLNKRTNLSFPLSLDLSGVDIIP